MAITKQTSGELKTRVNTCLNKLSDRDTLSMAANELETIARSLPNDAFAPFLNCLSTTDSSEKSPVRRQCVRLLGVLSAAHGDALSPHISRMISTVLRRLRDPDSAVRAACVDAVSSITTHVNSPPFTVILKPLVDALFHEQDLNAQIGSSLCLSAAVGAAPEPDAAELRKLLPRVLKLVKSDCFKAKPALLLFIGSITSSGCVKSKSSLSSVVSTAVEFLSSEDWAARKAAAEVLEKVVAAPERSLTAEFQGSCVAALESRRFDKVKVVRETMTRALEMWRDLPGLSEEASSPKDTSSSGDSASLLSGSAGNVGLETPQLRKTVATRSPASSCSSTTSNQKSTLGNEDSRLCFSSARKLNLKKNFRSRVVPFNCNDNANVAGGCSINDNIENQEFEDLSLIRRQLRQIENQQSDLLDLLQRFIGSSQKGMSSLEKRVDGLERVLDEMSHDFAISTRRMSGTDSGGNTCCTIPGAEFLSPKFWRRGDGQSIVNTKFPSSFRNQSFHGMAKCRDTSGEISKLVDSPRNC
ncbi:TORTIFOLIA1-like protein 4 [Sesamum angolense]|uniref:TORTIFOLIA1-like protein 4 n=1 Tax=Sesamum angolense TaxID=2727404 RepID=A0AAE1X090_9LAMI|nr:TORTIFOLIA1-like protein 4 [Sesamum angolense]